jgi:outer membrane protein, multidrug efflux system
VLLGRNPGPVARHVALLQETLPPEIPAGLPSALLERRPDIRLAEQNLRAANARVGVAMADFFPQIGLTSLFGQVSPELSAFTSGSANLWAVAGNMTGPVFRGGLLVARYRQEKAAWEEAKLIYEQTALNAFQEVSNALISHQKYAEVRTQQARAVKAYDEAFQISLKRYNAGRTSYFEVLLNQQQLFPAEITLSQTELNQLNVIVQLYKALGGGWQGTEAPMPAPMR